MPKEKDLSHQRRLYISNIPQLTVTRIQTRTDNKGVDRSQVLGEIIREIAADHKDEPNAETTGSHYIEVCGIPLSVKQQLQNAAKRRGVATTAFLKVKLYEKLNNGKL